MTASLAFREGHMAVQRQYLQRASHGTGVRKSSVQNSGQRGIRWVVASFIGVLTLTGVLWGFGGNHVVQAGDRPYSYTVQPGDTLWRIAVTVGGAPNDTPLEVQRIMDLNHMASASLVPGEQLLIPRE